MMRRIAVSIGCPSGIGPEVAVVAASKIRNVSILLVGDFDTLATAAKARGVQRPTPVSDPRTISGPGLFSWNPAAKKLDARDRILGAPTKISGAAQLRWVDEACDLVSDGTFDALVTAPVNKEVIAHSGAPGSNDFLGHTEYLQKRLHAREVVMAFWSKRLTTALVTTHLPLQCVPAAITAPAVSRAAYWVADFLGRLKRKSPKIAVLALNPHAGEGGLLGHEEAKISRGIELARKRIGAEKNLALLSGPIAAETGFRLAADGAFDGVVAMYHDQATIPMKLLAFGEEVNVSLGLPIIRTSVDHGTAYDRAPRFDADARGMGAALALAITLAKRRTSSASTR